MRRSARGPSPLTAEPQFVGAPIAAVAAETLEQARAALALLAPEIDALPFEVDLEAGLRAQRFTGEPAESRSAASRTRSRRARSASSSSCAPSFTCRRRSNRTPRSPTGRRTSSRSGPRRRGSSASATSSRSASRPPAASQVRVIADFIGGGFGSKVDAGTEGILAAELSRRAHRPVSLVFTRHEELLAGGHRASTHQTIRLAIAHEDGRLIGARVRLRDRHGRERHDADGPRPGDVGLPLRERARDALPGQAEPAAGQRVPRARLRRGHDRLRAGDRRAGGRAGDGSARAAPPCALRPRPEHRAAVLGEVAARLLRPRRRALRLGRARRRSRRRARRRPVARARLREPDVVRLRADRPAPARSASAPTGSSRS